MTVRSQDLAGIEKLCSGLSISRDGRTFLFVHVDEAGSDLVLVEDFR